jgi:hypothetical protein
LDSASIQAKATNDEAHLLQSTRFLRGTAPMVSAINEGQIANALTVESARVNVDSMNIIFDN